VKAAPLCELHVFLGRQAVFRGAGCLFSPAAAAAAAFDRAGSVIAAGQRLRVIQVPDGPYKDGAVNAIVRIGELK
jgi:hypothetical protein